jgi:hypothetical protein
MWSLCVATICLSVTGAAFPVMNVNTSLIPTKIKIGLHDSSYIGDKIPSISWTLECEAPAMMCRGKQQEAYQLQIKDAEHVTVYDSEKTISSTPLHELPGHHIAGLRSDEEYSLELFVWTNGNKIKEGALISFHTGLLDPPVDFQGEC